MTNQKPFKAEEARTGCPMTIVGKEYAKVTYIKPEGDSEHIVKVEWMIDNVPNAYHLKINAVGLGIHDESEEYVVMISEPKAAYPIKMLVWDGSESNAEERTVIAKVKNTYIALVSGFEKEFEAGEQFRVRAYWNAKNIN